MANLFNVGNAVICQKKGGQTGSKTTSPEFRGVVREVLSGGTEYRVKMQYGDAALFHFKDGVVKEEYMTGA